MFSAIYLIIIPLLFAFIAFLSSKRWAQVAALASGIVSMFYFLLLLGGYNATVEFTRGLELAWIPGTTAHFHVALDSACIMPIVLTQLLIIIAVLATFYKGETRHSSYYGLMLLTQAALNGFFTAQNPITFFVFFEAALIPIYFMVLRWGGVNRREAVFKFFIYTVTGGLLMLAAILYYYHIVGINELNRWSDLYVALTDPAQQSWLLLAFFIAFAIKAPIFPFHTWQAPLYCEADKPTVMIIAGALSKMGVFGLLRFVFAFPSAMEKWSPLLIGLCIAGIVYGALIAWRQNHMSRLLAYSSLSHMGLIAAGILTMTNKGIQGGLFQMLVHGLGSAGLFFIADNLYRRSGTENIQHIEGIAHKQPRFAVYFFILMLSSVGFPLTSGFIGEFYLLWSLTEYHVVAGAVALLTVILGAVYMLRFYQKTMFGRKDDEQSKEFKLSIHEDYIYLLLVAIVIALGLFPGTWLGIGQYAHHILTTHFLN